MHGLKLGPIAITSILLSAGVLTNCNCDTESFNPAANYRPDGNPGRDLIFGNVSVNSEKTVPLLVDSNGSAALRILAANLVSGSQAGTWNIEVSQELTDGLRPGTTSTVTVTFRPCPDAWTENTLKPDYDFNTCPGDLQAGDLNITDNTREGAASFGLSGQPVQPPVASVFCAVGPSECGSADPQLRECNGITMGMVSAGETPCDQIVELRNTWRNDKPVGTLEVERMEIFVRDRFTVPPGPIVAGQEVGFSLTTVDATTLNPDSESPFEVEVAAGATEGSSRFKIVFNGNRTGVFRGQLDDETGLRLYTNDPEQRVITVPISAQGTAPELACTCRGCQYGPVEQGNTKTATVACRNGGGADLNIANIAIESGNGEFVVSTDRGTTSNILLMLFETVDIFIRYTPSDTGLDVEKLIVTNNDPQNMRAEFDLSGGAVPKIKVDPADVLVFPFDPDEEPPVPPKMAPMVISNIGFGDLMVSQIEICGPGDPNMPDACNDTHPSVDDFTIEGCAGMNPCNINLSLCAPGTTGCGTNHTKSLEVTYANNDVSQLDLVNVNILSDDPANPVHRLVLQAQDVPCLFPTPIITVETNPACTDAPVLVNANLTNPGPTDATITDCEWSWLFTPGAAPAFNTQGLTTNSFVPTEDGAHIMGLHCTNSCGARSQTPAQETILVSDQCN